MDTHLFSVRIIGLENMTGERKKRRTVSGRRDKSIIRAYELQHRERALLDLLETYPNQMIRRLATQQEAEWHYGRLYLIGAITRDQYEAAAYLSKVTHAYEIMLRRYGHVRASGHEKFTSPTTEDLSKSAQKKFARIKKKYVPSLVALIGSVLEDHLVKYHNNILGRNLEVQLSDKISHLKMGLDNRRTVTVLETDPLDSWGNIVGERCPKCQAPALVSKEGCQTCLSCGYSNCG